MKRKNEETLESPSIKKAKLNTTSPSQHPTSSTQLISATSLKNYILGDPLVDWLELYGDKNKKSKEDQFSKSLKLKGLKFEEVIVKFINTNKVPITTISKDGKFS